MRISWEHATISPDGVVVPDWSTTPTCQGCGLRSACRALVQFVADHGGGDGSVVLAGGDERPENPTMRRALGAVADVVDPLQSHADWIVAHGVLERSSDPRRLAADWCAALRPGGRLALATTFDPGLDVTESLPDVNGGPRHRFGWDLLEVLSTAGFGDVAAHHAWGPWQGHLGWSNFVIGASA
jgi:SAM-dependent methyltransferase